MDRQEKTISKKRGRPATGLNPFVGLRIEPELLAAIDEAAKAEGIGRTEMIRRLIRQALRIDS